ncbi:MAG: hypothetical protein A2V81_00065 [Candidatus Abawacabacteria bacterium RBG_16_42_10]|uniref:DUF5667 domain-containing protein n=1 Tax=Candidatus Abawacabacteria bacterium RBG_16_42_10 TaxID=1817814 RepID=A0A1F4XLA9_9BACT|nr:MAG: hypothetical protein A2V81_00065 [Candidatus Abawacabacteria bacterium RBG_16_42_10]
MSWKNFFIIACVLSLGNFFVYAQTPTGLPTGTPTGSPTGTPEGLLPDPSEYNRVPDEALNAINNVSPQQVSELPESVRQDLARRQQEAMDDLREETLRNTGSAAASGTLPTGDSSSSSSSASSSSSSSSSSSTSSSGNGASFDPLMVATMYIADDNNIRQSNIADTLDMATKFEMQLWRQYYNTIAEDVSDIYDVYGDISDAFDDYSDELSTMLNRLPHTVSNCQRQ